MSHLSASTFVDMPIINKDYIEIRPIEFAQAKEVIGKFHKHNIAPQGHKFSMGIFSKTSSSFGRAYTNSPPKFNA